MSGEIHMYPGLVLSANAAIKTGKARPLAALTVNRLPALPDLPTLAEQGFPGINITNSYSLYAPAGTPRAIITAMNRVVGDFMNSPQMAQKLAAEGHAAQGEALLRVPNISHHALAGDMS
jgi:tripartite-type tricarboxylate transporter receptor subunit TctC